MSYLKKRLAERLKDPDFRQEWIDSELEYVIAHNIIKLRKEKKITQKQLATVLKTQQSVISRIENADQNITIGNLKEIAKALNVSVLDIFQVEEIKDIESIK